QGIDHRSRGVRTPARLRRTAGFHRENGGGKTANSPCEVLCQRGGGRQADHRSAEGRLSARVSERRSNQGRNRCFTRAKAPVVATPNPVGGNSSVGCDRGWRSDWVGHTGVVAAAAQERAHSNCCLATDQLESRSGERLLLRRPYR